MCWGDRSDHSGGKSSMIVFLENITATNGIGKTEKAKNIVRKILIKEMQSSKNNFYDRFLSLPRSISVSPVWPIAVKYIFPGFVLEKSSNWIINVASNQQPYESTTRADQRGPQ